LRDLLLRTLVGFGAVALLLTELLGAFGLLRPIPVAIAWVLVVGIGASVIAPRARGKWYRPKVRFRGLETVIGAVIASMVGLIALVAILSPPNSYDSLAYHLPRVIYWAQAGNVAFFPTPYLNQISLQPFYEYLILHTYLVTGGDRLVNLIACGSFAGCVIGVSAIAAAMGLSSRTQALAALFCATLPNAILQASGAKNDLLLAMWMSAAVYFAIRREARWLGLAVGLALATKATGYLFLPPILLGVVLPRRREMAWIAAGVLILNATQYARNLRFSGSPLGYDSAHGDGLFRWRNEHSGWRPLLSNALRHASEQLGTSREQWNRSVYDLVVRAHHALGLDPQDPDTTWRWSRYEPPRNTNHEVDANNRWHLLMIVVAVLWAAARKDLRWIRYAAGLLGGFLLYCWYLKWQPFQARMEIPLFILASVLAAWFMECLRPAWLALILCAVLINGARPALFQNWLRPLKGPQSLWTSSRKRDYFRDIAQMNNQASYFQSVDQVARSGCALVGLDISENPLEYPFQALLRARRPDVQFMHTGIAGAVGRSCAVLCLDCIGNEKKLAMYAGMNERVEIGRFLLFLDSR
jgi:hypothetical protein